ncbi:MAG: hypothetical protein ABIP21_13390 [Acidimicrobiia bacterium]
MIEPGTLATGDVRASVAERRRFLQVAGGVTAAVTVLIIILANRAADGHLVYVIDDPAIHMSMARQLANHGTWGVMNGVYEPASSSPLWTASLAAVSWLIPSSLNLLPLIFNAIAAATVLWIFASYQTFVTPRRGHPISYLATAALPVLLLFLPGMIMLGMEHVLHSVLILYAGLLVVRLEPTTLSPRAVAPLLGVLFVAGTVRVETVFFALGIAVALLVRRSAGFSSPDISWSRFAALRTGALAVGVSGLPFAIYGLINRGFGRSFLPNSVIAKAAQAQRGPFRSPGKVLEAVTSDSILIIFGLLVVGYLVWVGVSGHNAHVLSAVTLIVALLAQAEWGDIGWWNRYQMYLIMFGALVICRMATEVTVAATYRPALLVFLLTFVAVSTGRLGLTIATPLASSNTYRQRYQIGKFFETKYQGRAVATGELGYATLFHDGTVVDLLGLGTYDITVQMRDHDGVVPAKTVAALLATNHVRAIAVYPLTFEVSREPVGLWHAGRWVLREKNASAFQDTVDFYASNEREGHILERRLNAYAHQLPSRVKYMDHNALLEAFFNPSRK